MAGVFAEVVCVWWCWFFFCSFVCVWGGGWGVRWIGSDFLGEGGV